jgi:hypothetical protein
MPVWLLRLSLAVGSSAALALAGAAVASGDWSLLGHAGSALLGVAVLALLARQSPEPARSDGRRVPRRFASGVSALAALTAALAYDWRLDSLWTPLALLGVVWLAMLAIALHPRRARDPQ